MDKPSLTKKTSDFFVDHLPNNGVINTLIAGVVDDFDETDLAFYSDHLERLADKHNLQTLGLNIPAELNVFLWAYQDGVLQEICGGSQQAQARLRDIFSLWMPDLGRSAASLADEAINTMDHGIRVVAFGMELKDILDAHEGHIQDLVTIARERADLCDCFPDYEEKAKLIKKLIKAGQENILAGSLTRDALEATLFDALALPGNRLIITRLSAIDGIGDYHEEKKGQLTAIHDPMHGYGTFDHHLFPPPVPESARKNRPEHARINYKVTKAVLAAPAMLHLLRDHYEEVFSQLNPAVCMARDDTVIKLFNTDTGDVSVLPRPVASHPRVIPLKDKFPPPLREQFWWDKVRGKEPVRASLNELDRSERVAHQANHLEPRKIDRIQKLADALHYATVEPMRGR